MNYLPEHINQDIKGDKAKIRTQQYIKLNTGAKEIQLSINNLSKPLCMSYQHIFIEI